MRWYTRGRIGATVPPAPRRTWNEATSVQATAVGGYVFAGDVRAAGPHFPDSDVLLMKTEPDTTGHKSFSDIVAAPNPTMSGLTVYYALPVAGAVRVAVYDILGREVRELVSGNEYPGLHAVGWDGVDASGRAVASGIYFCQLQAGSTVTAGKVVIAR